MWDIRAARSIRSFFGPHICGDAIDVSGNKLLTGSYHINNQLQIWDLYNGRNLWTETLLNNNRPCLLYTTCFSKFDNGAIFAAGGSGSDEAYFYDSASLKPFGILSDLTQAVYSIDFAHTSNNLAVASGDGSIRLFEITRNRSEQAKIS